jgi:hypothetical protein
MANWGKWSMGKVLDVYWHFSEPGDQYLGQILAGLEPNSFKCAVLPPHWKMVNLMASLPVAEAMQLLYGPILEKYTGTKNDPTSLLLRCQASSIHHSDCFFQWLLSILDTSFEHLQFFNVENFLYN